MIGSPSTIISCDYCSNYITIGLLKLDNGNFDLKESIKHTIEHNDWNVFKRKYYCSDACLSEALIKESEDRKKIYSQKISI